ncbi:MAG: hypothetical protein OXU20_13710 [Myxococcales bacterium]|nr:hypothetical protein [Myxococcales bacterium]MDD9969194.1 hypothetical protein [Myxococcales bacterium]
MNKRGLTWGAAIAAGFVLVGCGPGIKTGRIGPTVPLPSGPPSSACESQGWLELAQSRAIATGTESTGLYTTTYRAEIEGYGVFRPGSDDNVSLPEVLPGFGEPALEEAHMAPIRAVEAAETRAIVWGVVGLGGMAAGLGTAAAIQEDSPTGAAVAGISGLIVGLIGVVGMLVEQPSGPEQVVADAHRQLFSAKVDDMSAVARGVNHSNAQQRGRCGGVAPPDVPADYVFGGGEAQPTVAAPPPPLHPPPDRGSPTSGAGEQQIW